MRTSLLAGMTTRGSSFLAAGVAAALTGYLLGERALLCVGIALAALPLLAATAARRGQYRLSVSRIIKPPRVPAGHTATVTLRVENISRSSTGLLLAEDAVPYALGARPRYVLDKIERKGTRELTYPLRSDLRGKFEIGPLSLRVADSFGLVEISRSLSARTTFVVTPRVVPLARTVISRSWAGEGEGQARLASMAGEDDVIPREYRDGDERRRVHWRSTARYGELMVRREEQRWRNRATVLLDGRSMAHVGTGTGASFELAISAAASVGVHVSQEGLTGQFISDNDLIRAGPFFEDRLLDALAVIRPSSMRTLDRAFKELKVVGGGVIIAILGRMSQAEARQLAACRTEGSQGIALLLDIAAWLEQRRPPSLDSSPAPDPAGPVGADGHRAADHDGDGQPDTQPRVIQSPESAGAAAVLRNAGWHVTTVDPHTPLSMAWQRLPRAAEMLVATGTTLYPGVGNGLPA
ncbi:MAG TPA: DUF58 domain-containing protein [Streptosporangiaceae bacterium]|nr:DUF58 domain-containing protein [Streptosporangiaceae bacterium]